MAGDARRSMSVCTLLPLRRGEARSAGRLLPAELVRVHVRLARHVGHRMCAGVHQL